MPECSHDRCRGAKRKTRVSPYPRNVGVAEMSSLALEWREALRGGPPVDGLILRQAVRSAVIGIADALTRREVPDTDACLAILGSLTLSYIDGIWPTGELGPQMLGLAAAVVATAQGKKHLLDPRLSQWMQEIAAGEEQPPA